jgi:RNA polymerase sigma factor (sigma-70 family)
MEAGMTVGELYEVWQVSVEPWLRKRIQRPSLGAGLCEDRLEDLLGSARDLVIERVAGRDVRDLTKYMSVAGLNAVRRLRRADQRRDDEAAAYSEECADTWSRAAQREGDTFDAFARAQLRPGIAKAMSWLSPEEREAVVLIYFRQMRVKDAAHAAGIPESTMSDRHMRALRALRAAVASVASSDCGFECALQHLLGDGITLVLGQA